MRLHTSAGALHGLESCYPRREPQRAYKSRSFRDVPCEAAGKILRNIRRILEGPVPDVLLLVGASGTTPHSDIATDERITRIKQEHIVRLISSNIDDAPVTAPKRLQHIDPSNTQLLRDLRC